MYMFSNSDINLALMEKLKLTTGEIIRQISLKIIHLALSFYVFSKS